MCIQSLSSVVTRCQVHLLPRVLCNGTLCYPGMSNTKANLSAIENDAVFDRRGHFLD
jgi:hypothetical protein